MYRPPGMIERIETNLNIKTSQFDDKVWNTMPAAKIFRRSKPDEKVQPVYGNNNDKIERSLNNVGGNGSNGNDTRKEKDKDYSQLSKKIEDLLVIHWKQDNAN